MAREHLPVLIGRKGANLRELEAQSGVVLDVEGGKDDAGEDGAPPPAEATVRITGLEAGIVKAQGLIETITSQVSRACNAQGMWSSMLAV